jgi:molecular chaperone DnaJ
MKRDYYAVLGVVSSASPVQIRRAYQRLARQYSPDVNVWEQNARALFAEIDEAYRVLSNPMARSLYDRQAAPETSRPTTSTAGTPRAGGRRGDDLHLPVELAFAHALGGFEADVPVERLSPCASCGAAGTLQGATPIACGECGGVGTLWRGGGTLHRESCPACAGAGVRIEDPCPQCRGRGVAPSRSIVRVILPPGVDTGAQFRIAGEGHSGPFGGPRGDLIVIARVHEDARFTRKGDNLYCEMPVTIAEAVLGARIVVQGADGELGLILRPGTQSGQAYRLRGKGMPRLSGEGRGDLYVTVRVEIPRGLDARTQALFRELGRLLPEISRTPLRTGGPA